MSQARFIPAETGPGDLIWIRSLLNGIFDVEDITTGEMKGRAIRLRGHFLVDTRIAYERLAPAFRARGRTLVFRRDEGQPAIFVVEGIVRPAPNNRWLPPLLAVLTVISVLVTYTVSWEASELSWAGVARGLGRGLQFTVSLLAILAAHELGHYFTARHFGVAVSLPYFIPFPLISPFGTMGAVISTKEVPPSRRVMLLMGAAGPLAGLIVALPVLILGLSLSEVLPLPVGGGYFMEGNSLLYGALKVLVFGRWLPSGGEDVFMHPIAFAGWAGLLVTAFNLIPAAQLDGGHVAYALLGAKARYLTWAVIGSLLLLGMWWQGWPLWAALIFFFSRARVEPLDSVSPLTGGEIAIAFGILTLFILTFMPIPLRIVP